MSESMIVLNHMSKSFGIVKAVSDVSFEIGRGEIRALIGENGSGKSTLTSLITGANSPDEGTVLYKGEEFRSRGLADAKKHGIAVLLQEKGTLDGLTVAENVFLNNEDKYKGIFGVSVDRMNKETQNILNRIGASHICAEDNINRYSFEDRKMVEVARAMIDDPDVLIVDETTTALTHTGRNTIYQIIKDLKAAGKTVIMISHDLDEIIEICDSASVLRDGKYVKTVSAAEMTQDTLRSLMIGREMNERYYRADYEDHVGGDVVLQASHITLPGFLEDVSLELHKGEILGLGGLTECGMHELCKVIFGALTPSEGKVELIRGGKKVEIKDCVTAIANKIAYLPKDRDAESLFTAASIRDNITIASIDDIQSGVYISPQKEKQLAKEQIAELSIKCSSETQYVSELSGGNKQKVVVGKWLANESEILIMDCPTRGIDIGVKSAIYRLMEKLTAQGKSIIMVSEEMPELIGMSDRIIALKDGRISNTFLRSARMREQDLVESII